MISPEDENDFQPLSSQGPKGLVTRVSSGALLTIVRLGPFALRERSKGQPVHRVPQALITAIAKLYDPTFPTLFGQRHRSGLSLKMSEGLPTSGRITQFRPQARQGRTGFGSRQPADQLSRWHG